MKSTRVQKLGDLQLAILRILWENGEATVAQVHESLSQSRPKKLAYVTVATMLRKMEGRGLVDHSVDGRTFIYRARVKEADVTRNMSDDLVDRLFGGSLTAAVSHLLESRDVSRSELNRLEKLIAQRKAGK